MVKSLLLKLLLLLAFIFFTTLSTVAITDNNKGFIENKGQIVNQNYQINSEVLYMYVGKDFKVQLRKSGYSYELLKATNLPVLTPGKKNNEAKKLIQTQLNSHRIDIDFIGISENLKVKADLKNTELSNYCINNLKVSTINTYNKVTYYNVYPAIDIEFIITKNESSPVKYNIVLHPGADLSKVKFLSRGATSITKSEDGALNFKTPIGSISENIPVSYYLQSPTVTQKINFNIENNNISFYGKYDTTKTFIIDPSSNRIWGTYFGGTSFDYCTATTINSNNDVFIVGYTLSNSNIATSGAFQSTASGSYDAYLAKYNSLGVLQWSTYFGGTGFDIFYNIHISSVGDIYVCGDSNSPSNIATINAHQTVYGGGIDDGILAKFNTNGQRIWSTYFGGNQHEIINGLTTDSNGDIVISGHTESTASIATTGAYSTIYNSGIDVFVAKFSTNGVQLWGTYYGDASVEESLSADCDASNNIYISGFTTSTAGISTMSGHQPIYGGNQDGFIAKFNASGTQLMWGSYYGGTGIDNVPKVQVDNFGDIYIAGNTTSPNSIASAVAHQTVLGSSDDGFLARFNSTGIRQWGTYFGGNDVDYIYDFILDANTNIIFCGETQSPNAISTIGAYQPSLTLVFDYDAYIAKFTSNGVQKIGTYFGGPNIDKATAIALDNTGKVYIAGETSSTISITSIGSNMPVYIGNGDNFLAKFCLAPEPIIIPTTSATVCNNSFYSYSTQINYNSYLWTGGATTNSLVANTASTGTYYYNVSVNDGFGCTATSDSVKLVVDICTFIETNESDFLFTLFPIPSTDFINLHVNNKNKGYTVTIFSSLGLLVSSFDTNQSNYNFNINELSVGIYLIRLRIDDAIVERKFIKY